MVVLNGDKIHDFPLTKELAEEVGIHIGDGHLGFHSRSYRNEYSGNFKTEKEYYTKYIPNLIKKAYGKRKFCFVRQKGTNAIKVVMISKEIALFKVHRLYLPLGPKKDIQIPSCLIKRKELMPYIIRGLFDTDGCFYLIKKRRKLHYYPQIKLEFKSRKLIEQISKYFDKIGFKHSLQFNVMRNLNGKTFYNHRVVISGIDRCKLWFEFFKPKNQHKVKKFKNWLNRLYSTFPEYFSRGYKKNMKTRRLTVLLKN